MHSFRLRYIVLGLLIYIQSAFCRTCGSDFEDVTSRAIRADVVLEGTAKRAGPLDSLGHYNVTFQVRRPFKGESSLQPGAGSSSRRKYELIIVGTFGPEDKDLCVKPVEVGSQYILFLNRAPERSFYRMSGFPETVSKKTVKSVKNGVCEKCAKRPKAKVTPQDTNVEVGKKIQIKCRVAGKPPPQVRWSKDGVLIKKDRKNRRYQIKDNRKGSRLRIRKAKLEDSGTYSCQAVSVVGQREVKSVVNVQLVDTSTPDHARKCDEQTFCLNGGTCYELNIGGTRNSGQRTNSEQIFCRCTQGFVGSRCQDKDIASILTAIESRELHHLDRTLTISGLVICALVVVGIFILSYCLARRKKKLFKKKKEAKQKSQPKLDNGASQKPLLNQPSAPQPPPPKADINSTSTQTDVSGLPKTLEVVAPPDQPVYCQPPPLPNHHPHRSHPHDQPHPHHRHVQEQLAYEAQRRQSNPSHRDPGHRHPQHRDSGRRDSAHSDSSHRDPMHRDPMHRDPTRRDSGHRDSGHRESGHRDSERQESGDSGRRESGRRDSGHREPSHHDSARRNSGRHDGLYRENGRYDSGYRDSGHDDSGIPRNLGHTDPGRNLGHTDPGRSPGHSDPGFRDPGHRDPGPRDSGRRNSGQRDRNREMNVYDPHRPLLMHETSEPPKHYHPQSYHRNVTPEGPPVSLHQNMPPAYENIPPSDTGRQRLPATSGPPDPDRDRQQIGGNVETVNAVVETEPNQKSELSDTPKEEPTQEEGALKAQSMEDSVESKASLSLDLDQRSDYDNQASDMEVNLESEADIHALDASGDELEGPGGELGSGQAEDSDSSPTTDSEDSSSIDEERALFQQMVQNPLVNSRNNSLSQLPTTEEQKGGALPNWPAYNNQSPMFSQLGATYPFNSPFAEPFEKNKDVITNRHFQDNHSAPPRKKKEAEQIKEFPYDPDPDATVV